MNLIKVFSSLCIVALMLVTLNQSSVGACSSIPQGARWGYIDRTGKPIIQPQFHLALPFSEELALVSLGDRLAYINKSGSVVIRLDAQFNDASDFSEGLAAVRTQTLEWGFIDRTGKIVIEPQFRCRHTGGPSCGFHEGLAAVGVGDNWGFIDKTAKFVINPQFSDAGHFSEGLAPVRKGEWGFIDKTGRMVIRPQFHDADSFSQGLAVVRMLQKWGFINKTGRVAIPLRYDWARAFSDGLAIVMTENGVRKNYSYVDRTGRVAIKLPLSYEERGFLNPVEPFSEGLACVAVGDKYGYIDKTGRVIINPRFSRANRFSDGLAPVEF